MTRTAFLSALSSIALAPFVAFRKKEPEQPINKMALVEDEMSKINLSTKEAEFGLYIDGKLITKFKAFTHGGNLTNIISKY